MCHTLAIGRSLYPFARIALCRNAKEAADALSSNDPAKVVSGERAALGPPVTFLFPGQGSQHVYMARELYNEEPVFRREIDRCAELLKPHLGLDLARRCCFPRRMTRREAEESLRNTQFAQPAIFAVSYALAKLWMSLGVTPAASLGHSIGEFVSACLAEVFSLEDALRAVAARGRLMQSMPGGAMLAVMTPAEQLDAAAAAIDLDRRHQHAGGQRSIRSERRHCQRSTRSSAREELPQRRSIRRTHSTPA